MAKKGRPVKTIDESKLDLALSLAATCKMCADYLDVSVSFLEKYITKKYEMSFGEYRDRKMAGTKLKLIQKALSKALDGDNTMLIFSLKNLCGWADKVDYGFNEDKQTIVLKYNLNDKKEKTDSSN